jgi:thioester reductase-like protein
VSTNEAPFIACFRATAREQASRVAIEDGRSQVTYAELEARAGAIASELRAQGAREGDVVAVRSGDRTAIATGMLATWTANAAFVVIPPELPEERAQLMARDAHVAFTLDRTILEATPAHEQFGDPSLAYVVFTSGTTGKPKGVLVTHAGIVPMLDAQIAAFELHPGARCLWLSSPLFDASISDVGTALLSGATLVCGDARLSPRALVARMDALGITHVDLPPSLLALLDVASLPKSLRTIVIGGESCADAVVERTSSRMRLVNVYGPTEATVCTSLCVCNPGDRHHGRLGLPLPHVKYLVEDGELLIGGTCLARGYADDAALTRRRFVERSGERFYRTGDRVRVRDGGVELELVGRVDRQVKIAGVRIEPEEIESRLRDDRDVLDVAVIPVGRALRAFVVMRHGCDVVAVRARLAKGVPSWLVPARFVTPKSLPRLPSGKVDHAALLALATSDANVATPVSDEKVRALCEAMGTALGRAVAPDDDFVAEGADSLTILEACAEADARGLIVSPETIATHRTAMRIATSREIAGASIAALDADVAATLQGRIVDTAPVGGRAVFVTGATGTLGMRLVREIVATGAIVTCLVRAHGDGAALERLRVALPGVANVRAVAGDVALPCFGMPSARFAALATEHDAIVHAAADLSLAAAYTQLRDTNVLGTAHALDFAREGRPKALHHISTLSVLASAHRVSGVRVFSEASDLHDATTVYGAYAQTKWVAEALVRRAAPGAFVHRLGLLLPARKQDLFTAFVVGVAALGCAPVCPALAFDVTPTDFAARALAHFVALGGAQRTRHIANRWTASLDDLVYAMAAEGVRVERVSMDAFQRRLADRSKIGGLPFTTLRAALFTAGEPAVNPFDLFEATNVRFGAEPTLEELAQCGIVCEAPTNVLAGYVRIALARGAA